MCAVKAVMCISLYYADRVVLSKTDITVQRVALARIVGFVTSFLDSSTGWWAILQLLCSQGWKKIARGTSKKYKQNLLFELTPLSVVLAEAAHFKTAF